MKFLAVNDLDPNETEEIEAFDADEAAHKMLLTLGWWISNSYDETTEQNPQKELTGSD